MSLESEAEIRQERQEYLDRTLSKRIIELRKLAFEILNLYKDAETKLIWQLAVVFPGDIQPELDSLNKQIENYKEQING